MCVFFFPRSCQNHWDHVISKDLIHWQRLPPPIQPLTLKTWDGSISMLPASIPQHQLVSEPPKNVACVHFRVQPGPGTLKHVTMILRPLVE